MTPLQLETLLFIFFSASFLGALVSQVLVVYFLRNKAKREALKQNKLNREQAEELAKELSDLFNKPNHNPNRPIA